MFGEQPLSKLARELLLRERGRSEDEALKSRAFDRARAALQNDRPSGIGFRRVGAVATTKPRQMVRTVTLAAAAIAAAGLAVAGVGAYTWRDADKVRPLSVQMPAPRSPGVAVGGGLLGATPSLEKTVEPRPEPAVTPAPPANDARRSLSVRQYATELALLEPARSSISRGDYSAALAAIGRHRREFPSGQLSEEREALRVRALWGLGQRPAALTAAKAFRKRYPKSALLGWLKDQGDEAP